jgi:hypothetical protein
MRRRTLLVALAGLAVVAAGAVVLWPREDRVTRANFHRIGFGRVGSRAELLSVLGPPGDFTSGPVATAGRFEELASVPSECVLSGSSDYWKTDTASVYVLAMKDDRAFLVYQRENRLPQGALDNLWWRAKRQWHRWFP